MLSRARTRVVLRPLALGPRSAQPAAAAAATAPAVSQPVAGTPAYLQQACDLSYLSQTGGRGDTVAIVDAYNDPTAESDLATFRSTSGLAACTTANGCFRKVNQNGAASPLPAGDRGWEEEISLDVDAVSALCPNCHILLVEANSTMSTDMAAAMQNAAALGAKQVSDSRSVSSSAPVGGTYTLPGVAVVAATGDHGYPGAGVDNYLAAYKISTADAGAVFRVIETASSNAGSTTVWSARSVGPITSADAGFAVLGSGHAAVRGRAGRTLAIAMLRRRVLTVHRPPSDGRAPARAWACPVVGIAGGAPPRCAAVVTLQRQRIAAPRELLPRPRASRRGGGPQLDRVGELSRLLLQPGRDCR